MYKTVIERDKDAEARCASFILNMKTEVFIAYAVGKQITYDDRFVIPRLSGESRVDVMRAAVVGLRDSLYCVWPRAREIKYVKRILYCLLNLMNRSEDNADKVTETNTALVNLYHCRCWADPPVAVEGYPSENCKGQVFVTVTEPNEDTYQVHYKIHHG